MGSIQTWPTWYPATVSHALSNYRMSKHTHTNPSRFQQAYISLIFKYLICLLDRKANRVPVKTANELNVTNKRMKNKINSQRPSTIPTCVDASMCIGTSISNIILRKDWHEFNMDRWRGERGKWWAGIFGTVSAYLEFLFCFQIHCSFWVQNSEENGFELLTLAFISANILNYYNPFRKYHLNSWKCFLGMNQVKFSWKIIHTIHCRSREISPSKKPLRRELQIQFSVSSNKI